jgi:hypothetical protein
MFSKTARSSRLLMLWCLCVFCADSRAAAQNRPNLLDPNDPRLTFSFPIKPGADPFRFKVGLDTDGTISNVSDFRKDQTQPFQTLPACEKFADQVSESWLDAEISLLVAHADLNFDGFEDLELLQFYIPHLDKKLYCIFLWDDKGGQFRYSKDLSDISSNIEADPKTKTIKTREDWQGGPWEETTYRWNAGKLEVIEDNSLIGGWDDPANKKCGFGFTCSRLIHGKMTVTLAKDICTPDEMDSLPDCPAAAAPTAGASKGTPAPVTTH